MVSSTTASEIFRKLREDEENRVCFDCNYIDVTHASVNLGIMLCSNCAARHLSLGIEISNIRSLRDPWTTRHLKLMTAGGNSSLKTFFAMYSIPLNSPNEYKYRTIACEYYREMLKMMAEDNRIMMVTPSQEEGGLLMEEFRPVEEPTEKVPGPKGIKGFKEVVETSENTIDKIKQSETFSVIKGFTSDAFGFVSQGIKWGAEKGKEGLEWSAQQGKKLIRQVSNRESLKEEALNMYEKLQKNLNLGNLKKETLDMLKELEDKYERANRN